MADAAPARSVLAREALEAWLGASVSFGAATDRRRASLEVAPPLASVLPGGGFPQGSVVELASPANLGHGLGVALAACAASQRASALRGADTAWCAFLDPDRTLFGPAVRASGIALERLLVLRPPRQLLAKVAVKVAASRIFSVIVVDVAQVPGASSPAKSHRSESMELWSKVARRLSLAVEKTPTTVFLLTRAEAPRASSLPVSMRVELENAGPGSLFVRVAKDRFGRVTSPREIAWTRPGVQVGVRAQAGER